MMNLKIPFVRRLKCKMGNLALKRICGGRTLQDQKRCKLMNDILRQIWKTSRSNVYLNAKQASKHKLHLSMLLFLRKICWEFGFFERICFWDINTDSIKILAASTLWNWDFIHWERKKHSRAVFSWSW